MTIIFDKYFDFIKNLFKSIESIKAIQINIWKSVQSIEKLFENIKYLYNFQNFSSID